MRTFVLSSALSALLLSGCATPGGGPEYKVLDTKTSTGETVYGLVCTNGTATCNYNWETLCKTGKAYNSSPLGGKSGDAPAYTNAGGVPVRLFICAS